MERFDCVATHGTFAVVSYNGEQYHHLLKQLAFKTNWTAVSLVAIRGAGQLEGLGCSSKNVQVVDLKSLGVLFKPVHKRVQSQTATYESIPAISL